MIQKRTNIKIVSIMLCMLVFTASMPMMQAMSIPEEKMNEKLTSSERCLMVGFIKGDWIYVHHAWYLKGFEPVLVFGVSITDSGLPLPFVIGPWFNYYDVKDFSYKGHIGSFTICAVLTLYSTV